VVYSEKQMVSILLSNRYRKLPVHEVGIKLVTSVCLVHRLEYGT